MPGIGDVAAWWDNEKASLRKKLARAWEAARNDPKGAFEEFAKGTADYGAARLEQLIRAVRPWAPGASLLPTEQIREMLRPTPGFDESSDLRDLGAMAGVPEPGGGQLLGPARRELFKRVPAKLKSAVLQDLYTHGDRLTTLHKYGALPIGREVYEEIAADSLKVRPWAPGESVVKFGDIIEYPELVAEHNRITGKDLNQMPVHRMPGYGGYIQPGVNANNPGSHPLSMVRMGLGDQSMRAIVEHEGTHILDSLQSGTVAGANYKEILKDTLTNNPRAQLLGITPSTISNVAYNHPDPVMRAFAKQLADDAFAKYLKDAGESRARISEGRLDLTLPVRRLHDPLSIDPANPKVYEWDSLVGHTFANRTGTDLTKKLPSEWDLGPQIAQRVLTGSGLDDYFTRPKITADAIERALRGEPVAKRLPRLRRADDIDELLRQFIEGSD